MKSSASKKSKSRPTLQRKWSGKLVDAPERAQSRAMLHAVGFERGDFKKSQIGIASTWSQVTPCNIHIDKLAIASSEGVAKAGSKPLIFNTITISDGISMGTQGMKFSLVSREVIADSIETVMGCELPAVASPTRSPSWPKYSRSCRICGRAISLLSNEIVSRNLGGS